MLELETKLRLNEATALSPNLCDRFSEEDLTTLGNHVVEGYEHDLTSRSKWERRTQTAMNLAMQVQVMKSFPWPGASNIAFPLVTIGALQFHSRAYSALIDGSDIVKCRVIGTDPTGEKSARATRIAQHMSWQLLEQDGAWEEQKDRLLLNLPIVGTVFVKSYFDPELSHTVGETVLAQDFVIDYWAKSVESCPRKTHCVPLFRNQLHSNMKRGIFRDVSEEGWYGQPPRNPSEPSDAKRDNRTGVVPPQPDDTTPYMCLEQHVDLDLDQDGYAEPYIVTVEKESRCVLRLVAGFDSMDAVQRNRDDEVISVKRTEYFTKYEFFPSPDGGIYGIGFGVLLGPLNEATNSLINQLVDAGTWSITAGGFMGRGAKIRGGTFTFAPREWKRVDSTGDDLRKSIVPLEVREPNGVLFQLLSLLINYVERLSGTTDPMVGENPGQNTTAETMRTMVQEGQRVYNSVFKRAWRSMKSEFKKVFQLNAVHLPETVGFREGQSVRREDYSGDPDAVVPSADPKITSEQMQVAQAQLLKQSAATTPGYDIAEVERRYLKALRIEAPDKVFPGPEKVPAPKDVKLQIQEMKVQLAQAQLEAEQGRFVAELMETRRMDDAEIAKISSEIINMKATLEGDVQDREISQANAVLGALKLRNETKTKQIELYLKTLEMKREQSDDK